MAFMPILYVAHALDAPSHEWMRRMLHGLGSDVAMVATNSPARTLAGVSFAVRVIAAPPLVHRAANRLGLLKRSPWEHYQSNAMRRLVARRDVTCVLVHFLTIAVTYSEAWASCDKPVIVHCHGYDVTWDLRRYDGVPEHSTDYVERVLALPNNVRFIANSLETRGRLRHIGIADERIHVKYLGVPVPECPRLHHKQDECTILYVGRLVDCKAPDLVIQAFELACRRGLRGRLIVAGDGMLRVTCDLLRARSPYRDRIDILGAVDASVVGRLLSQADIFTAHNCRGAITNQEEAFGVSIVEAMGAGLPVVSGRSGSLPEIIQSGQEGILVEPGDVDAHAEALLRLAASPEVRNRMGRNGWQRARSMFSIEHEIEALRSILSLQKPRSQPSAVGDPAGAAPSPQRPDFTR
ncbi:MAG: glycosyltransferase family 4 protein [Planctomycetes bacterium]|nr:glycosyltransferase family 4 protein [Planctomycetota bacterium]MBU4398812.1 glycosyltransferase family 4 protein [Planctomycetota bacterium]